jgi:hypothetical protein
LSLHAAIDMTYGMKTLVLLLLGVFLGCALGQEKTRIRVIGLQASADGEAEDQKFPRIIRFAGTQGKVIPRQLSQNEFSPLIEVGGGRLELPIYLPSSPEDNPWTTIRLPRSGDYLVCFIRNEEVAQPASNDPLSNSKAGKMTWQNPQVFIFEALEGNGGDETSHFLNASPFKILFRKGRERTMEISSGGKVTLTLAGDDEDILVGLRGSDGKPRVAYQGKAGNADGARRYFLTFGGHEDGVKVRLLHEKGGRIRVSEL